MRYFKFKILILIGYFSVVSCKNEEQVEPTYSFELDGKYRLISTTTVHPVDLNFDGYFSTDLIQETNQAENKERFFLYLESIGYNWTPTYYDQRIFLWSPLANAILNQDGVYLRTGYGITNLLAKYRYNPQNNRVDVLGNLGGGIVDSVYRTEPDILQIHYRQYFYTTNGWEELSLISNYKKI
ncbi:MAG: hypothetical protein KF775_12860 [Cyclobacteriaceae bacterium]|nr:hypothetical protein [Cyclobacteriaceae bacterium]